MYMPVRDGSVGGGIISAIGGIEERNAKMCGNIDWRKKRA